MMTHSLIVSSIAMMMMVYDLLIGIWHLMTTDCEEYHLIIIHRRERGKNSHLKMLHLEVFSEVYH